uniref:Uncharacterized protein n=1 Tax=Knipowitschia caucasica TaxID=637954 RepID=A0AAV2M8M5_KNICA
METSRQHHKDMISTNAGCGGTTLMGRGEGKACWALPASDEGGKSGTNAVTVAPLQQRWRQMKAWAVRVGVV